jgi:tetratricopeptide (TPR) repeat protein
MKPFPGPAITRLALGTAFVFLLLLTQNALSASTLMGTIYDKQRNPLPDIEIELLDDLYRVVYPGGRTRTDGSGRYHFYGLNDGYYTIRILAFRYDLEDQERTVLLETQNIRGGQGTGTFNEDFYLSPKKGGLKDAELSVIFAQEVPKAAETAYKKAVELFSKKQDEEAFTELKRSLELFPKYYSALYLFGFELFTRKQYPEAASAFMEAMKVNPKSPTALYYLGNSFHNMGNDYNKAALTALTEAYSLAPASLQVLWLLGKIEREMGKFTEAEAHLLKAEKLSTTKVPEIHKELAQLYANDLKKYDAAANQLELYLKASKLSDEDEKKTKQLIADLRIKAKAQARN